GVYSGYLDAIPFLLCQEGSWTSLGSSLKIFSVNSIPAWFSLFTVSCIPRDRLNAIASSFIGFVATLSDKIISSALLLHPLRILHFGEFSIPLQVPAVVFQAHHVSAASGEGHET
ncbi:hypothetical protein ACJX0J_034705, partial [Zea mays]